MMYQSTAGPAASNAGLEDYLRAIKANKLLILVITAAVVALAVWYDSTRTDVYEAQARVVVGPSPVGSTDNKLRAPVLEREREVMSSDATATAVIQRLGLDLSAPALLDEVAVDFVPASEVMRVSATSTDPQRAAEVANAFAQVYVDQRQAAAVDLYERHRATLQERAELARARVESLRQQLDQTSDPTDASNRRTELSAALTAQAEADRALNQVQLDLNVNHATASVLSTAGVPGRPIGVGRSMLAAAGLVVGLSLGVVGAFLRERLDTTARDESRAGLALGTNVLTSVPVLPFSSRSGSAALVMISSARSKQANRARESYRRLRSSLSFLAASSSRPPGGFAVTITSALPAEGKSVTSGNLAIALAQSGSKVALVNADLRNPTIEALFESSALGGDGLSTYLAGGADLTPVPVRNLDNLILIPAGPKAHNPTELLGSEAFRILMKSLREEADYVLVDCPPVLAAADPSVVARETDGVVIVVDSRTTDTTELLQVRADLERSGASIIGAVLNRDRRRAATKWRLRNRYGT